MYRIVKDTYKDGSVKYRVQTDRFFFGWFHSKTWRDCSDYMSVLRFPAVFNTIEEARNLKNLSVFGEQLEIFEITVKEQIVK